MDIEPQPGTQYLDSSPSAEEVVAIAPEATLPEVGALLARALLHDPFPSFMLPEPSERERLLPWHYESLARFAEQAGEVWATTGPLRGAAVWLWRDDQPQSFERLERSGLIDAPKVLGTDAFRRYSSIVGYLERVHRREVPTPHWHLSNVGVEPSAQGQGIGAALLSPMLRRADMEGVYCYLETFEPRTLSLYRRLGFDAVVDEVEPTSQLRVWALKRAPQTGGR